MSSLQMRVLGVLLSSVLLNEQLLGAEPGHSQGHLPAPSHPCLMGSLLPGWMLEPE